MKKEMKEKITKIFFEEKEEEKKNEIYYNEQKANCILILIISIFFIMGLVLKTVTNMKTIEDIKTMFFLILPILFMNATFFTLLKICKNQAKDRFFKKENETLFQSIVYTTMLFIISLLILLNKDALGTHQLYIILMMGIYFLVSGSFIKKIFQYELKKEN